VVGAQGAAVRTYTQRCSKKVFEAVANLINETRVGDGLSMAAIAFHLAMPETQVNIALEFLKERGIVEVRHRRSYPATQDSYLDAMIEWHALAGD
jgi:DNA-binding transcriptional regulator LsrR (DeoR family)